MFKIVEAATGEGVGSVGYWERESSEGLVYETGWLVLPAFQGRGVATNATAQVIERARAERTHRFLYAYPAVDNAASNAICRKLGFTLIRVNEYEFPPGSGNILHCNDWRLDLFANSGSSATSGAGPTLSPVAGPAQLAPYAASRTSSSPGSASTAAADGTDSTTTAASTAPSSRDRGEHVERDREAVGERRTARRQRPGVRAEVVARVRRGDRRCGGDADRAADLLARVDQAGGDAGLGVAHAGERADRDRDERRTPSRCPPIRNAGKRSQK